MPRAYSYAVSQRRREIGIRSAGAEPDPLTYLVMPAVLAAAAALSSYLPARRAAAVDPVRTLKED